MRPKTHWTTRFQRTTRSSVHDTRRLDLRIQRCRAQATDKHRSQACNARTKTSTVTETKSNLSDPPLRFAPPRTHPASSFSRGLPSRTSHARRTQNQRKATTSSYHIVRNTEQATGSCLPETTGVSGHENSQNEFGGIPGEVEKTQLIGCGHKIETWSGTRQQPCAATQGQQHR